MAKNSFFHHLILAALFSVFFYGTYPESQAQVIPGTNTETEAEETQEVKWAEDSLSRRTPQGTVMGFINSVSNQNYSRAKRYLDLPESQSGAEGENLVRKLQNLLDRGGRMMPSSWLSSDYDGRTEDDLPPEIDRVGTLTANGESIDLYVEKTVDPEGAPIWLFSRATLQSVASIDPDDPSVVERLLPAVLENNFWGGVPVGHWLAAVLLAVVSYLLASLIIILFILVLKKLWLKARQEQVSGILDALSLPLKLYLAIWFYVMLSRVVGISISVRLQFGNIIVIIAVIAFLILLWRLIDFLGTYSKKRLSEKGNVAGVSAILFLRRAAKVAIVIFGIIAILSAFGINVTAGIAALGIGGLALALGAQKTIENLVGSVTLVADQPVRVGDFCKVGDTLGHVEKIGMRSTRIRTLNRTVVTIPNGQFSSDKIENYAHRDRFLFNPILDLRYETSPDQIRFLLVEIRTILYSHPMVNPEPARSRFTELGASSIKLEIFSYINAPNFEIFLEVKEDLLLRIMDKVGESGTDFAFPSQTIYLARDKGLSKEKGEEAAGKVQNWKENREMQIPSFDPDKIKDLKDTIKYPPDGSVKEERDKGEKLF